MSEIINLTKISPARVKIHRMTAIEFFNVFLENNAQELKEVLSSTEKGDQIFA
jgi:hypothetical protein